MPLLYVADNINCQLPKLPLEVKRVPVNADIPVDPNAEGLVVRFIPSARLKYIASRLPNLRWVQLLTAGVDAAINADLPEKVVISKGVGIHEAPTAELAVTLLLSCVRRMHVWRDDQRKHQWNSKAYAFQIDNAAPYDRATLEGAKVLILGMGIIGQEIGKRLLPFGAIVEGVAQTAGMRDGFKVHANADMLKAVAQADAVIAVLPETPETRGILSRDLFNAMQKHAWLVSAGRGSALDEKALIEALKSSRIAGAAMDVAQQEPLPKDSPLWDVENLVITPHIGGGGPNFYKKACALIAENAQRFVKGEPLLHVIDRKRGY
ncbi:MAG: phosphoglycerate dehydrogenase [Proteobacteria bacterium]|nr:phosphoglycerate dehydrogenase [Pseudomonadota bacterium]